MKRAIAVAMLAMLLVPALAGLSQANVSFGTRNLAIKSVNVSNCDGVVCDVRVVGVMDVRNSGTKDLIVTCPVTVHRWNKGPVAWGEAKVLLYAGGSQRITWEAWGTGTIDQSWNRKGDPAKYWVGRGTDGTPRQPQNVSCVEL